MVLSMFTHPARTEPAPYSPEPWPEIGETWKPEGVTIVERYANLAGAVVLVYSADRDGYHHVIACLGCHHLVSRNKDRTYNTRYTLEDAAKVANDHASTCRALPRDIPTRPDDDVARKLLHQWVLSVPRRVEPLTLYLSDFDEERLTLQRTNGWIEKELQGFAAERPDLLSAKPSEYSSSIEFTLLGKPS
ncbi:hypothetical protein ACFYZH_31905 [Streptomyces abikoensis]|uniref:hypothetical protein n=1 Tax=Streptomyces abikoensis TaxID=97398 RepID=UPI00368FD28A